MIRDRSPFDIERYRQAGWALASRGDRRLSTAFSAVEQAQWDLVGKALGAPVYDLVGGRLRNELPVYANVNRATADRGPDGFAASARQAVADGFGAISPHNPSGPVSTMVSAQVCAGLPNFDILEYQWNEVPWRGDLVEPPERFTNGILEVPDGAGIGITLNETVVREHS